MNLVGLPCNFVKIQLLQPIFLGNVKFGRHVYHEVTRKDISRNHVQKDFCHFSLKWPFLVQSACFQVFCLSIPKQVHGGLRRQESQDMPVFILEHSCALYEYVVLGVKRAPAQRRLPRVEYTLSNHLKSNVTRCVHKVNGALLLSIVSSLHDDFWNAEEWVGAGKRLCACACLSQLIAQGGLIKSFTGAIMHFWWWARRLMKCHFAFKQEQMHNCRGWLQNTCFTARIWHVFSFISLANKPAASTRLSSHETRVLALSVTLIFGMFAWLNQLLLCAGFNYLTSKENGNSKSLFKLEPTVYRNSSSPLWH